MYMYIDVNWICDTLIDSFTTTTTTTTTATTTTTTTSTTILSIAEIIEYLHVHADKNMPDLSQRRVCKILID